MQNVAIGGSPTSRSKSAVFPPCGHNIGMRRVEGMCVSVCACVEERARRRGAAGWGGLVGGGGGEHGAGLGRR